MPVGSIGQDHGSNRSSRWWSSSRAALECTGMGVPYMIGCVFHWFSVGTFAEHVFDLNVSLLLDTTATSRTVAPDLSPLESWTQGMAGGVLAFLLLALLWPTLPLIPVLSSATPLVRGRLSSSVAIWPGSNMTFLQALPNLSNHCLSVTLVWGRRSPSFPSLRERGEVRE